MYVWTRPSSQRFLLCPQDVRRRRSYIRKSGECSFSVESLYCCCLMMSRQSPRTCKHIQICAKRHNWGKQQHQTAIISAMFFRNTKSPREHLNGCTVHCDYTDILPSWCPEVEWLHHPRACRRRKKLCSPPLTSCSGHPLAHCQGEAESWSHPVPLSTLCYWATGTGN